MQKLLILSLVLLAVTLNAQTEKIAGNWLMVKAETNGETSEPYQDFEFSADGKMLGMGMEFGTWEYDESANAIVMRSEMDKDFNGESKILALTDNKMTVEKDGVKFYYEKLNHDKIIKDNEQSGLAGVWDIQNDEGMRRIVKFEKPDNFTFININGGTTETSRGSWIFNPDEKSLIVISFHNPLRGKSKIVEITNDKLVLEKEGQKLIATKGETDSPKIERLTFTTEDFPEEQPEIQLPEAWYDLQAMAEKLGGVKELVFKSGKLIKDMNSFNYATYISEIEVNKEKPSVMFTNLFVEKSDTSQYSQDYKGGLSESYNYFFPKDEPYPYRSLGVQTITVPAGTFECTVIEGFDADKKIKYWLVNDMPGVYAKTIEEGEDPFGEKEYFVTELEKIAR